MGWALKERKKNAKFSKAQVNFLVDIYTEGEKSGRKKDPVSIAQLMKTATTEKGDKLFRPSEYLRKEQISSYFSRLTYQRRKGNAHLQDNVESGSHNDDDNDSMEEDDSELDEEDNDENNREENESDNSEEESEDEDDSDTDEDLLCAIEEDRRDMETQNDLETMSHTLSIISDSPEQSNNKICQSNKKDDDWEIFPVYGDGNCLFRAITCEENNNLLSCARNEGGYPLDAQCADLEKRSAHELRLRTVSMLRSSKELIENHAKDLGLEYLWDTYGSMEKHSEQMEKNSEYGGQPELLALTHVLERPIVFHYKDSTKTTEFGECFASQPSIHLLYYEEEKDDQGNQIKAGHDNLLKRVVLLSQEGSLFAIGDYVTVRFGKSKWYMAIITEVDNETEEVKLNFMEKTGKLFAFSEEEEKWLAMSTIIHKCSVPSMDGRMRYSFDAIDIKLITEKMKSYQ